MSSFVKYCIVAAFILGIGFCIYLINGGELSAREAALLSVVLTTLSVLATWIVTHMYSESQHKKAIEEVQEFHRTSLRTYALNAAEKVGNLSNQLGSLAAYLGESLEDSDNERLLDTLLTKEERIASAIQIINTLKSVNDTALSDWEGVIGDELAEQREIQEERQEELSNLIERLETISESQRDTQKYAQDSTQALASELNSIKRDLRSMGVRLGVSAIRVTKSREKIQKSQVETNCPECGEVMKYRQRRNPESIKTLKCEACGTKLIARYDTEKGFILEKSVIAQEKVKCPVCGGMCEVGLDTFPLSSIAVECSNCHEKITVKRTFVGIKVKGEKPIVETKTTVIPKGRGSGIHPEGS